MKNKFLLVSSIAALMFCACAKLESDVAVTRSKMVFYSDTFRVYSSDMNGNNQQVILDVKSKVGFDRIIAMSALPDSGKVIIAKLVANKYIISIIKGNGTEQKDLVTAAGSQSILSVKGLKGGKVCYSVLLSGSPPNAVYETRIMNADGSDNQKLDLPAGLLGLANESSTSNEGKGYLTFSSSGNLNTQIQTVVSTFYPFNNWVYSGTSRKVLDLSLPLNGLSPFARPIISNDGTKMGYVNVLAGGKYEILVKDISSSTGATFTLYTYQLPASGPGAIENPYVMSINWIDGESKILLTYGKYSYWNGANTDYTYCAIIDPASGVIKNWTLQGEGSVRVAVD